MFSGYEHLTEKDYNRIVRENYKCGWGFTKEQFKRLVYAHKHGDTHRREYIELRLSDANFHSESGLLMRGQYDEALNSFMKGW